MRIETLDDLNRALPIWQTTPAVLRSLLSDLGEDWTHRNYGEATWSPFDVLGHLIHGEKTDWLPRLRHILEHGQDRVFTPFDRVAQERDSMGKTMAELLDEFEVRRSVNLKALHDINLQPDQFALRGMHPELGPVTLGELLGAWAVHDLHHIAQCCKAVAYQLKDGAGPWRAYLGILPR